MWGQLTSGRATGKGSTSSMQAIITVGMSARVRIILALQIVSFGQGLDGELYVLHCGGTIHQMVDAP